MAGCLCQCGGTSNVERHNLITGNTKHCSSCANRRKSERHVSHGHSWAHAKRGSVEAKCYYTWQAMKRRCSSPSDKRYEDYGGRGISVCTRWQESYEAFLADMGLPPSKSHQIERLDNDGDYEPGNCEWVLREQNGRNKRNNRVIEADGRSLTLVEWAEDTGLKREAIAARLKRGWTPEEALNLTPRKRWSRKP